MEFKFNLLIIATILPINCIVNAAEVNSKTNKSNNSQIRLELKEQNKWGKYTLKNGNDELGYITFQASSTKAEGYISMFHISPDFRSKNFDLILMWTALNRLFKKYKVKSVILAPQPFEHNKQLNPRPLDALKDYYKNRFGFEEKGAFMKLTREKYLNQVNIRSNL